MSKYKHHLTRYELTQTILTGNLGNLLKGKVYTIPYDTRAFGDWWKGADNAYEGVYVETPDSNGKLRLVKTMNTGLKPGIYRKNVDGIYLRTGFHPDHWTGELPRPERLHPCECQTHSKCYCDCYSSSPNSSCGGCGCRQPSEAERHLPSTSKEPKHLMQTPQLAIIQVKDKVVAFHDAD